MANPLREGLKAAGTDRLVDALLCLAAYDRLAMDAVERIVAPGDVLMERIHDKMAALKSRGRFIGWQYVLSYSAELRSLLEDIRAADPEPRKGVELVAAFYEADADILEQCDDSSGHVGDVFRHEAQELFVHFAARCEDKAWLVDLAVRLYAQDEYGVREPIIAAATRYLQEKDARALVGRLENLASQALSDHKTRHLLLGIEFVAKQLKDAALFEATRRRISPGLSPACCQEIARVYLDAGHPQEALDWIEKVPEEPNYKWERDRLLLAVYDKLGRKRECGEVAWRLFRRDPSAGTLKGLLSIIGEDKREQVIEAETDRILGSGGFLTASASFLIECERVEAAELYFLGRADQLDGGFYGELLPIAERFKKAKYPLAATIAYRALLTSILDHAHARAYKYGARYLQDLDLLAKCIQAWQSFKSHEDFKADLQKKHYRKTSFRTSIKM